MSPGLVCAAAGHGGRYRGGHSAVMSGLGARKPSPLAPITRTPAKSVAPWHDAGPQTGLFYNVLIYIEKGRSFRPYFELPPVIRRAIT